MPDLGVAWPELNPKDTAPAAEPTTAAVSAQSRPRMPSPRGTGNLRYTVSLEGLTALGDGDELLRHFRAQSSLEAERKDPANAAQIGRRANCRRRPAEPVAPLAGLL